MAIVRNFNLFLSAGHSIPLVINANQYDQGESWVFTLFNSDGTQYIPETGAIVGIKSDGLGIINSGSVVDGKVVITETQQMTAAPGKAVFELMIDNGTHGTANFLVLVEPKPGNNADLSDSDLSLIQEALDAVSPLPTGGSVGQVLTKTANGSTWSDAGTPTQEQVAEAVSDWADENITVETGVVIDNSLSVAGAAADSAKVGSEISDLKSAFSDAIEKTSSKNIFNGVTEQGYLASDGTITTHSNWITTDFIPVGGLTAVTSSGKNSSTGNRNTIVMFYLCTYDSSKTFIEQVGRTDNTYTVGTDVEYIRFSWHPTDYTEIQVESGTVATAYEAYKVLYKFTDSPYLSDYVVDKFNIYDKANNILGEYINSSGTVVSSSSGVRCLVPCKYGDVLDICRPQKPQYASGNGLMLVYNSSMTVLASVDMEQYATIEYGTYAAVRYPVTNQTAAFISFNVKLSNYDSTEDTIVSARNINSVYTGDYISEINNLKLWAVNGADALWKDKKWVVFGDSLTAVNERTTKHYFDYVADETGINVVNMGDSGSGYKAEDDVSTAFYQRISNVPTDADVITIFGSFNDLSTGADFGTATDTGTTTIGGCINTTLDNLFTAYPLAVVGIISPTPWVNANPTDEPNRASQYCDLLKAICERRSIPYLDLFHCSLLRPWDSTFRQLAYSKDEGNGVHPDETGHKLIAPRFKGFLESLIL